MHFPDAKVHPAKQRHRTCCGICHIKFGTAILGSAEAIVCVTVLMSAVQQIVWKTAGSHNCSDDGLQDCLIFHFSHFDVTLVFDYMVIAMMSLMLLSICLLLYGIITNTSCVLLPHILIQAILLLFSIGYFCLYAVSYFYGDLYKHSRPFKTIQFIERMWLAILLLALTAFQTYLFSSVIRCSMYISRIEDERRRRALAFDRCSERVRIAKEKGIYQAATLDESSEKKAQDLEEVAIKPRQPSKKGTHVQWSSQDPTEAVVDETTTVPLTSFPATTGKHLGQSRSVDESASRSAKISHHRRRSDTLGKDNAGTTTSTQLAMSPVIGQPSASTTEMPLTSKPTRSERSTSRNKREAVEGSPSPSRSSPEKTSGRTRHPEPTAGLATRKRSTSSHRPPLQKLKSCEDDYEVIPLSQRSARCTSVDTDDRESSKTNRKTSCTTITEKTYPHIKRVSITATHL
ncbi:hypothetical protein GCK32_007164 [Trichostrongylus colubriformis]|uniref:Uncharacterized protein n=1 Tax=Trichostrongylus colubriformis TaxID=6319 RepID=A0AAN8FIE6_TRICO